MFCVFCDNLAKFPPIKPTHCYECWEHQIDLTSWAESCAACHRITITSNFCGRCRTRRYCDRACQRFDWEVHKEYCVEQQYKFARYVDIERIAIRYDSTWLQDQIDRLSALNSGKKSVYCTITIAYFTKALHLNQVVACCICLSNNASLQVFLRCGHRCVCDTCGEKLKGVCPICRTKQGFGTVNALNWDQRVFVV